MSVDLLASPQVGEGSPGEVELNSIPVRVVPGTYEVSELPRFGQKISQGSLKYADFNPEEQAFSMEGFGDGYGLRRFSDVPSVTTRYGNTFTAEDLVARVVKETSNIDGRTGPAVLAPLVTVETLTGCSTPPIWCGEYTVRAGALAGQTKWVAIAGTKLWYRASNGTWTDTGITLPANAAKGCVGVFGKLLIIGFGTSAGAVYTDDLATTGQLQMPSTLPTPVGVTYRDVVTGGALNFNTAYYYRVSATNASGETLASAESSITTANDANATHKVVLTWPTIPGAASYKVYGRATGAELLIATVTINTYTDDGSVVPAGALPVANTTGANVAPFVFAFTSDQAAAYIAGGINSTDTNLVISSANGILYGAASTSTVCGDNGSPINALCPGGGTLALVFVGKTREFGFISTGSVYERAVPLDVTLNTNCVGMRLYLSLGGDEGRGPTVVVFPFNRTLLSYTPSSQFNGTTEDLAPYGREGFRPVNARGVVGAMQGTSRFLYYAITNGSGNTWIISKNSVTGANSTFLNLGANACQTLGYTSLFASNPLLFMGYANGIASIVMPLDGDYTPDDSACRYAATGWLDTPDIDIGFPDEDKVGVAIHVVADSVVAGHQDISVQVSLDGGAWGPNLGFCDTSSSPYHTETIIPFATNAIFKRVSVRVTMATDDSTKTAVLLALSVRVMLNTTIYRLWQFQGDIPNADWGTGAGSTRNGVTDRAAWWAARKAGLPVPFMDRDNNNFVVKILKLAEKGVEPGEERMPYVCRMSFTLLELVIGVGNNTYGSAVATYGGNATLYG